MSSTAPPSSDRTQGTPGLPEGHPLAELHARRVKKNQDLLVVITDWHNRRGTGKSVLTLQLADACDMTPDGLTLDKCSMSASELADAYIEQPKGSSLVLDEAEQDLSKYRAGTHTNMAIRQLVSMGRIEEKYVFLNLPASAELDRDLLALCDVWVLVENRGQARVHFLEYNPYEQKLLPRKVQNLGWGDLKPDPRLRGIYNKLTKQKQQRLRGETSDGESFVKAADVKQQVEKAREQAQREQRDNDIRAFYEETESTQQEVADALGLSRSRVANILRE